MLRPSVTRLKATLGNLAARHRARHRPTGFGFVLADRIAFLDGGKWDAVAANGSFFLRRSVLRVIEEHGPENVTPRYAMVFRGEVPVAIVAAQVVEVHGREHFAPSVRPVVELARKRLKQRLIVAGNLLSWGCDGVAFAPGESPADLWPAVAEALYRLRRALRLEGQAGFHLVKDLAPQHTGVEALHRFSYRPLETEPNMVLTLDPAWHTYDDYLVALDSKNRRTARDQVKALERAGCVVATLSPGEMTHHAARLHALYRGVQQNAAVRLVTVPDGYFPALAAAVGDDFRCSVIKRGDDILGFVTSVRSGATAVGYYIGFDREAAAAESLPLYLRLLHTTIADAIGWRCGRLSLGRTALQPKAGLGARPEPMTVWVRHRVPVLNWIVREALGAVPHAEAPVRNPFKEPR